MKITLLIDIFHVKQPTSLVRNSISASYSGPELFVICTTTAVHASRQDVGRTFSWSSNAFIILDFPETSAPTTPIVVVGKLTFLSSSSRSLLGNKHVNSLKLRMVNKWHNRAIFAPVTFVNQYSNFVNHQMRHQATGKWAVSPVIADVHF